LLDSPLTPEPVAVDGGDPEGLTALQLGTLGDVTTVHVPYTVEQDEDGVWCAHAWLGSSGGANGNGVTPEEAVADLREAVQMVIEEDGIPAQLAQTLDLEVA
jgi:predicted RNase H-like HicB family nuclease